MMRNNWARQEHKRQRKEGEAKESKGDHNGEKKQA
jgi:hypothetical protein